MLKSFFLLLLGSLSFLSAGQDLYDRNYYGLDWGRGGAYGRDNGCPCTKDQDPDCQCDK